MKTIAVADAFLKEEYYRACFEKHPGYQLSQVIHFGSPDRKSMRDPIHMIERNGPDAVEPPEALYTAVEDADVLMVHLCPVNRRVIERGKNLKVILLNRGGTENVDLKAAAEHNIAVLNNPAHNANSVAELTIGADAQRNAQFGPYPRRFDAGCMARAFFKPGPGLRNCGQNPWESLGLAILAAVWPVS